MRARNRRGVRTRARRLLLAAILGTVVVMPVPPVTAAGELDGGFGTAGKVTTSFVGVPSSEAVVAGVAIQTTGKVVAAGTAATTDTPFDGSKFVLARYTATGVLDPTFGVAGVVYTDFGGTRDTARAIVVRPDNRLVVAGETCVSPPSGVRNCRLVLAGYTSEGQPDSSFGDAGKVFAEPVPLQLNGSASASDLAIYPPDAAGENAGKLILSGTVERLDEDSQQQTTFAVLVRFLPNGDLDNTFASGGTARRILGSAESYKKVAIRADGRIVALGSSNNLYGFSDIGATDNTFGDHGAAPLSVGSIGSPIFTSLILHPEGDPNDHDGKIMAGGQGAAAETTGFLLARRTSTGDPDPSFGAPDGSLGRVGHVTTSFTTEDLPYAVITALVLDKNGKAVAGGPACTAATQGICKFGLARYLSNGDLDQSFGTRGLVVTEFNESASLTALAEYPKVAGANSGKLLAAGDVTAGLSVPVPGVPSPQKRGSEFGLARYSGTVTAGPVSASMSRVKASPASVPADGQAISTITIKLRDAYENPVVGKQVSLASTAGSASPTISAPSGPSNESGAVTFTVKSATGGTNTFTATDTTDSVIIAQTAQVSFTSRTSASNSTTSASPTSVVADGQTFSTVTVTLKDGDGNASAGKNVALVKSYGPGAPTISGPSGPSDDSGIVTFKVSSNTAGTNTFTATDTTDSVTIVQPAQVTFTAVPVTTTTTTTTTTTSPATSTTAVSASDTTTSTPPGTSRTSGGEEAQISPTTAGYRLLGSDGGLFSFGEARFFGSAAASAHKHPIVGMASTRSGQGYWMAAADATVFAFGDAQRLAWPGSGPLNRPVVGLASSPAGNGYWMVGDDGGVFALGDARFLGSTGAIRLAKPVVSMAPTPSGNGYWLVASDGGVFAFGDARFLGSTGGTKINRPIVSMAPTPSGNGYWLVASDGGVFAFGDARFLGSTGGTTLNRPVVSMASTSSGNGYWLVASDGGVFAFGDARFLGSTGAITLNRPIVAMGR